MIQRQSVGIFGDQHMREQSCEGTAAADSATLAPELADCLAGAARELRLHVAERAERRRDVVQRLRHVLAEQMQGVAAASQGRWWPCRVSPLHGAEVAWPVSRGAAAEAAGSALAGARLPSAGLLNEAAYPLSLSQKPQRCYAAWRSHALGQII
jgi:hypothetical protein